MDAQTQDAEGEAGPGFASVKISLSSQFCINSALVRVADLSRMMGIPANSIHAMLRQGRFPIPHRRVGSVVVVKLDDFVEWYCNGDPPAAIAASQAAKAPSQPPEPEPEPEPVRSAPDVARARVDVYPVPAAFEETSKERVARFKREAHIALKRRGLLR